MNELQRVHKMVWRFRAVMSPHWATPEPMDCLRYAFCEAGEAMDAWLRQQRPGDSRNNERNPDVLDELADCAIMLLSAVGDVNWEGWNQELYDINVDDLPHVFHLIFYSAHASGLDGADLIDNCLFTTEQISNYEGMDLEARVAHRLFKIANKHAPDEETRLRAIDTLYE